MSDTSNLLSQFYVKIGGQNGTEQFMHDLVSVTIDSSLYQPDMAVVTLHDDKVYWVDAAHLDMGKTVEIAAKAGQGEQSLFDGEIVEVEPVYDQSAHNVVFRAFDRMHRLLRGKHSRTFNNMTDEDIVRKIAGEVGLQVKMEPTSPAHDHVYQHNQTNLEFLRHRADRIGRVLYVRGKTLHCERPHVAGSPVKLEWGKTCSTFSARLSTHGQVDEVLVRGWNPDTKKEIVGRAQKGDGAPKIGESRSGGEVAHQAYSIATQEFVLDTPIDTQEEAQNIAKARLDELTRDFVHAEGSCGGNPAIIPGASVEISGVGDRFGGTYLVTEATHRFSAKESYATHFEVSRHPETISSILRPQQHSAPMQGMFIGVVTDNQDPKDQGRVKVKYPAISGEHASAWARLVVPGGGADRGVQFLPEVNDEVFVAFEQGDIHFPYILGGLWNGQDAPPKKSGDVIGGGKVQKRIIRSRTGHTITLDDSDGGGGITIEDKNGNKIALDTGSNTLTIEVKGSAKVKAQAGLSLETDGNLSLKASGQVEIKGAIINLN